VVAIAVLLLAALGVTSFGHLLFFSRLLSRPRRAPVEVQLDKGAFAPGACTAFGPTHGDRHVTVFLDAGHGGIDPGGTGTTESGNPVEESEVNLAIELDTLALLRAHGYRVVVSRTKDTTVVRLNPEDTDDGVLSLQGSHDDVVARDLCSNLAKAKVLVGIYMDAGDSAQEAGSVSIYDSDRPFANRNLVLAQLLQTDVLGAMNARGWQIPDDGVQPDTTFGSYVGDPNAGGIAAAAAAYDHLLLIGPAQPGFFSTPSEMPGAVIEPLYLTDPFEASIAASSAGREVIAHGLARAIEQFLSSPRTGRPKARAASRDATSGGHDARPGQLRCARIAPSGAASAVPQTGVLRRRPPPPANPRSGAASTKKAGLGPSRRS
jgi:N-acetylmuramoyl-L-alanine amidase